MERIFNLTAKDEFGRQFGYTHICQDYEFEFGPDWIYQYYFVRMARDILEQMGTAVYAEWECYEEEWN